MSVAMQTAPPEIEARPYQIKAADMADVDAGQIIRTIRPAAGVPLASILRPNAWAGVMHFFLQKDSSGNIIPRAYDTMPLVIVSPKCRSYWALLLLHAVEEKSARPVVVLHLPRLGGDARILVDDIEPIFLVDAEKYGVRRISDNQRLAGKMTFSTEELAIEWINANYAPKRKQ